ncbi:ferredoxin [Streptomyces sp. NBC_00378]|uniref:ferredoxin n=1 Tax=unclassified Streptomyces TaxID=2593676 RepID=UPI0022514A5D|nr:MULTISPECIES: ferredoxin [unclassified Streptomyces]MCX5110348.1 ferredoxin [Streptomyces sp. NBC_00378]
MAWNVRVDPQLCQGSGMCAGTVPEVFVLDGERARVRSDGTEPDERVLDAADICPALAITVHDGNTVIGPRRD